MKNIFNLSFEDSKNVIYKLKSITTSNPELAKSLQKIILIFMLPSLFIIFILLEIGIYITHPKNNIGKLIMVLVGSLWLIGLFFMIIFPLFKHKNFASMYKKIVLGTSGLLWAAGLSMAYPLTTLKNAGVISFGLQVASLIILICFFFYLGVTSKTKNIKNRKEKEKNKGAILKISVFEGIVLIGALIAAEFHNNFILNFEYIFEKLIVFAVFWIAYLVVVRGFFKMYLTFYYLEKYSRQYRLYYRIPDSVWYFSKEEAEKRNDPVYPLRRKKVSED